MLVAGFDPVFYRALYTDLAGLSNNAAKLHYVRHGRSEGRHGSFPLFIRHLERRYGASSTPLIVHEYRNIYPGLSNALGSDVDLAEYFFRQGRSEGQYASYSDMLARLRQRYGELPAGFNVAEYRKLNPDLAAAYVDNEQYIAHFLEQGRASGRAYSAFHPTVYRNLYRPDWPLDEARLKRDWRNHRGEGRFVTWEEMLKAHGFKFGPWLDYLNLAEFNALNAHWVGPVQNKEQAALVFVTEGWRRLAPLHLGGDFDAEYYRARHPALAKLADEELYKDWLLNRPGEASSPRKQLSHLGLNLSAYPATFPWAAYVAAYPGAYPDKWSALEDFLNRGFPHLGFIPDSTSAPFFNALADSYAIRNDDRNAIKAHDAANRLAPLDPEARQHLGDAYLRLGLWGRAACEYAQLLENGSYTLWTVLNAASCALRLNDAAKALEVLKLGQRDFSGNQTWLGRLNEAMEAAFNHGAFVAHNFYDQDQVAEGDRSLLQAVHQTVEHLTKLAPMGTPIPASPDGRIVILANQDLRQCTHYRVEQKAELMEALGRPCEIFSPAEAAAFTHALAGATAAIFYRLPATPPIVKAILSARALDIPTYYEIDDLVFDSSVYPPPLETYGGQLSRTAYNGLRFGAPLFRAAMALCDYGIASTTPLANQMASVVRTGTCFVVRNGLDSRNDAVPSHTASERRDDDIMVFYGSGTLAHNSDFLELAAPAILNSMSRNPRVKLSIAGHLVLDERFDGLGARVIRHAFVSDTATYWSHLRSADINLAVLVPDAMTDCKSEIKWLEAAVFGIPSIVSSTASYRDVLEDGKDVLMATSSQDWILALNSLVENAELRRQIGAEARTKAMALYDIAAGARSLERALAPADDRRLTRPKLKPRLLLVNLFFPPQVFGGATRVVRDNVDSWIANGFADEFEIAVMASDYEAEPTYATRVDSYRGIPVFRIATPREINQDWRPLNSRMGEIFKRFLSIWQPDLVHFHAIQQLTASCVEECQRSDTPYVVTIHDAWWISDWQFLIDHEGRLQGAADPLVDPTSTGITPEQSSQRKARLAEALHKADAVLAVSSAFADIYRQAGITETIALPNGAPHIERLPRRPSATGRVRLGHMGGMTVHKGYPLIYAALRQGRYDNLELTIVDHERSSGEEHQVWGTTPVRIIPRCPQTAVPELYAEMDVLLAPSTWPESYGLVSREALACGLWVVASDLGAMGEDVIPEANGFVIDVSSPDGLRAILGRISDDPQRFLASPASVTIPRSTDDQAADLIAVYKRILAERSSRAPRATPRTGAKEDRNSEAVQIELRGRQR